MYVCIVSATHEPWNPGISAKVDSLLASKDPVRVIGHVEVKGEEQDLDICIDNVQGAFVLAGDNHEIAACGLPNFVDSKILKELWVRGRGSALKGSQKRCPGFQEFRVDKLAPKWALAKCPDTSMSGEDLNLMVLSMEDTLVLDYNLILQDTFSVTESRDN